MKPNFKKQLLIGASIIGGTLSTLAQTTSEILTSYSFEQNLNENTGNGITGLPFSTINYETGALGTGYAATFDGVSSGVNIGKLSGNGQLASANLSNFTIEFYFKSTLPDTYSATVYQTLFKSLYIGNNNGMALGMDLHRAYLGSMDLYLRDDLGATWQLIIDASSKFDGKWHKATFVVNKDNAGNKIVGYIDGVNKEGNFISVGTPSAFIDFNSDFILGVENIRDFAYRNRFVGALDEFKIYKNSQIPVNFCESHGVPSADVEPQNVTVCTGSQATLNAASGYTYLWNNSQTTQSISANTGTHQVILTNSFGCSATQNWTVNSQSATLSVIKSIPNCNKVTLAAQAGFSSYLWSTGETTQKIDAPVGTYTVSATNNIGCTYSNTITVNSADVYNNNLNSTLNSYCAKSTSNLNHMIYSTYYGVVKEYQFKFISPNGLEYNYNTTTQQCNLWMLKDVNQKALKYNTTYKIYARVWKDLNTNNIMEEGELSPYSSSSCDYTVNKPEISMAWQYCNGSTAQASTSNTNTRVYTSNTVFNAKKYFFKFSDINNISESGIYTCENVSGNQCNLYELKNNQGVFLKYNTTYNMCAKIWVDDNYDNVMQDNEVGPWGPACQYTVNKPQVEIGWQYCGKTYNNLNQIIYTSISVSGATRYDFVFTNTLSGVTHSYSNLNNNGLPLSLLFPTLEANQSYYVKVKPWVGDLEGEFSVNSCTISTGSLALRVGNISESETELSAENNNSFNSINAEVKELFIYPNPTISGEVNVILTGDIKESVLSIRDISGKLVYSSPVMGNNIKINLFDVEKGIYIVNVVSNKDNLTKRLIVK